MTLPTLYKRDAKGGIQQWTAHIEGNGFYVVKGKVGGKLTRTAPFTCEGKNLGRANETTPYQQAMREAQSEWEKKLKRGYAQDINGIDEVTFKKPMKGDRWKDRASEVTFPVWVQDKLNGVRCQSVADRSYSTGGETFYAIPHIREALASIFAKYPNAFIDAELFNYKMRKHLNRLTEIVSVNVKPQHLTPELLAESAQLVQLHIFDGHGFNGITPETPWEERHESVGDLLREHTKFANPSLYMVPRERANNLDELMVKLQKNRRSGGEGLIVRHGKCEFKYGRSKYMLKLKHFEDAEFDILAIEEGNGDWKGCAKRIILKLHKPATTGETSFASNIEGDRAWLRTLFERREEFIGQPATCEFQQYSEYGIPQIGYVRAIRNYE